MDLSGPDRPDDGALAKDPFLAALGERTRALRLRRGLTRKGLARAADVSERHLANVEMGVGNASVQFLRQLATALDCSLAEIHSLYGPAAYRRYERRALEDALRRQPKAVIATPGGIVSDPATFSLLLAECYTVWVRASPEEHMGRVLAQGDTRPMAGHAGNREAMNDLRRILESRAAFYAKADTVFETSGRTVDEAFAALRELLEEEGVVATA